MKCLIPNCLSKGKTAQVRYYKFPTAEWRQRLWMMKCGLSEVPIIGGHVCSLHFIKEDFDVKGQRSILKLNAVPRLTTSEDQLLQARCVENNSNQVDNMNIVDTIAEVPNSGEQIELINEELFDENDVQIKTVALDEEFEHTATESDQIPTKNMEILTTKYYSSAVQTGSSKTQACGMIELTCDSRTYTMNCFYCSLQCPIWNWTKFVNHMKDQHRLTENVYKNSVDLYDNVPMSAQTQKGCFTIHTKDVDESVKSTPLQTPEFIKVNADIFSEEFVKETVAAKDESTKLEFISINKTEVNEVTEVNERPFKKKKKLKLTYPDFSSDDEETEDEHVNQNADEDPSEQELTDIQNNTREIRFGKTHPRLVMNFLELLSTFPVLWKYQANKKAADIKAFNAAITQITNDMNAKWSISISDAKMRQSLSRIKDWYRRVRDYTNIRQALNENYKHKFHKYFLKCREFLPNADPVVLCETCNSPFRTENMLQVHNFTRHNIGQLPYHCIACDLRYDTLQKLTIHKRTVHPPSKDKIFTCQICNQSYLNEYQLQRHNIVHTEGYNTTCEVCGKKCKHARAYRLHVILHKPPKYKCQLCEKIYHRQFRLTQHMKLHRNERNYVCDICGKLFLRQKGLKEHKNTVHSLERKRRCLICDCTYKTYAALKQHRLSRHLVLEGSIEDLLKNKKKERQKYTKLTAVDPVTKTMRYICNTCGSSYKYFSGLARHRRDVHGYISNRKPPTKRKQLKKEDVNKKANGMNETAVIEERTEDRDIVMINIAVESTEVVDNGFEVVKDILYADDEKTIADITDCDSNACENNEYSLLIESVYENIV